MWKDERREIKKYVLEHGFNDDIGCFTQTFDGDRVDAATLRIGSVGFLPFDDERIQGTIDAVMAELMTDDGLVYRYEGGDGIEGDEGAFVLCSFWLIECLALSGRTSEARGIFESVMSYANPLGLFAEEIDPETGEQRGNFPQAFSHVGLINSALYLAHAESDESLSHTIGMEPAQSIDDQARSD